MRTLICSFGNGRKGQEPGMKIMAGFEELPDLEWIETFAAPEYVITHVGKPERLEGTDMIVISCGLQRGKIIELKYRVIMPITRVPLLTRLTAESAENVHYEVNLRELKARRGSH
jgi:hypothetical protein